MNVMTESIATTALRPFMLGGQLFAVLDACDAPAVPLLCNGLGTSRAVSLYRGEAEERYADIAPYLVHVTDETVMDWLLAYAATPAWGILLIAPIGFELVRSHLRKFLKVLGPDGRRLYFRFYDPRVLTLFLPTCDRSQLEQLFGPLLAYGTLDGEGVATTYRLSGAPTVLNQSTRLAAAQSANSDVASARVGGDVPPAAHR